MEYGREKGLFMKRSILLISRENSINHVIVNNIMDSFTVVFCALTSTRAIEMIMRDTFNLIILDILLPDMAGSMLLQIIRRLCNSPVLVLMHREIEDRIKILDLGADDCMVWPVNADELIVRVESCMKRGMEQMALKIVSNKQIGLMIDPCKRTVKIRNRGIILTKREFDILYLLADNPGVVFSKEQIYTIIWKDKFVNDNSNIMSHISRLRKKMGEEAGKHIKTVWGIGYRFADGGQVEY